MAPLIVGWLQAASDRQGSAGDSKGSVVELLQSAFQTGNIRKIYGLSAKADESLSTILTVSSHPATSILLPESRFPRLAIFRPESTIPIVD